MMSRISGNQTYNNNHSCSSSEQQANANANVSGVSTTATDLASAATTTTLTPTAAAAATFNRQRKRRKKKKDKLMLTNQQRAAVNCSCGKRIEGSCNSVSSYSNCVPTACVYCHFNDSTNRENNYSSLPLSRHHDDLIDDFNENTEQKIDFWSSTPVKVPPPPPTSQNNTINNYSHNNNNHIKSDIAAQTLTKQNNYHFKRHQRNNNNNNNLDNGINRHTEQQLQRFAIYENLCEYCGFAIGNGAYHLHCVAENQPTTINIIGSSCSEQQHFDEVKSENIYENICDLCHSIFDGEQCMSETCKTITKTIQIDRGNIPVSVVGEVIDVLLKKPPIAHTNNTNNRQFGKQFSEFLGSFKQKLTSKSGVSDGDRKRPKIEIIHNIDTVFKTNKTFDLNEIVQLKNHQLSVVSSCGSVEDDKKTCVNATTDVNTCSEFKVDSRISRNSSGSIDLVTEVPLKPIRLSRRTSTSDSNFLEKYNRSLSAATTAGARAGVVAAATSTSAAQQSYFLQTPFSESIVSDTILYSNSYAPPSYEDAIQHSKYACVAPFKLRGHNKSATYDSTSASSFFTYNSSNNSTQQSHSFADYNRKSPLVTSLLLSESDDSVKEWLTSIEHEIHEYADSNNSQFECGSMKCLPSKMLNESVNKLKPSIDPDSDTNSNKNMNEMTANPRNNAHITKNLRHRIELFKENLLEHRMYSKRNAIYIKDSMCDVTFDAATPPTTTTAPDTIAPDIEIATTVDSTSLVPVHYHNNIDGNGDDDDNNNNENSVGIVLLRRQKSQEPSTDAIVEATAPIHTLSHEQPINYIDAFEATSQYLQMLKAFYMTQVTLSTSLNRIVLVCGDRKLYFFVKYLVSQSHTSSLEHCPSALVQPTKYTNVQQIIQLIHKMCVKNQLGDNGGKSAQITSNGASSNSSDSDGKSGSSMVNGFLMRSTNSPSRIPLRSRHKQTIDDYARRKQRTNNQQQKQKVKTDNTKESNTISIAIKNPDYSSLPMPLPPPHAITSNANTCNTVQKKINSEESTRKKNDNDDDVDDDESIYQPIWMFKTIGSANDTVAYENDILNNFDTCENETNDNRMDDTTSHDAHEWEVAQEEFLFSSSHIKTAVRNILENSTTNRQQMNHTLVDGEKVAAAQLSEVKAKTEQFKINNNNSNDKLQYQTICVLYNTVDPKWNEIIYDYNNNNNNKNPNRFRDRNDGHTPIMDTRECNRSHEKNVLNDKISGGPNKNAHELPLRRRRRQRLSSSNSNSTNDQEVAMIKLDSVNAWKSMLRTIDYLDDEEDVILTESYLLNQKSALYNNQNNENLQSAHSNESVSDTTTIKSSESEKTEETDVSSDLSINLSIAPSISPSRSPPPPPPASSLAAPPPPTIESKPKKESGFLNKLQYRRFDVSRNNNTKKDDVVQGLFYKNLNGKTNLEPSPPMEIKRLNQNGTSGSIVFGAALDDVEKDEQFPDIPRFVVECIRVIEIEENLHTNGIYRASGKKDSIDKLRKRMNESKLRKGTKYVSLKDEDVHTITGALKQFFRELKSELIPEDIVKNLPNDLENEASIPSIRNGLSTIDYLSRETLKYLLQHLIRVDANREHNLMTASNLSIVWGASLFTSSVNITNAFETSDLLRRNTLIKVLIQRYDDIFIDIDRLI